MRIYNTMSREKEEFVPINGNRVKMFVCGPTVYDMAHIGHARTYVMYDIMARYLRFKGYSLFFLMNITDVDDKIIARAKEEGVDPLELSRRYTEEFYRDMAALRISSVNLFAKASEHIPEIIEQISALLEKGYAYEVDGEVYFDISKFPDYGKLSRQNPEDLKRHRIEPSPKKRDPADFALWKPAKPGEPCWDSPWGKGRPGWHIEDTAISHTYFGPQYDIHGGAIELVFPHHEAEIAQAEAFSGKRPFVKYWVHTGILMIKGEKMAKSLKNYITIREALERWGWEALRIFYAMSHYRSPIDFDERGLEQAKAIRDRVRSLLAKMGSIEPGGGEAGPGAEEIMRKIEENERKFMEAMDDDFNTPEAIAAVISLCRELERYMAGEVNKAVISRAKSAFDKFSRILGAFSGDEAPGALMDGLIRLILDIRDEARRRGDWDTADNIRARLRSLGIALEDSQRGTIWRFEA
ncbi:MAG: cysteine--tRNA ligase [Candidatus Bathyarchaeia archaeon]